MTTVQFTIYAILLVVVVCLIAGLMEIYKKSIRKGKAKAWENYLIAFLLTVSSLLLLIFSGTFHPMLEQIGAKVWMDYVSYVIVIYFLQFNADRKIIKKIIRSFVSNFLKKSGLSDSQIKEILDTTKK